MAVYTDAIQKLYVAYFNRPADYEGLAFWEKVLVGNGGNIAFVSSTFAKSAEYQQQIAGKSYFQIVNQIYQNLFNRDADVQGLEFWAARLREGTFTVDQIVKVIADNASDTDAKDKTIYTNKVAAATAFTAELNTAAEIIGYSGDKANAAAKIWLSGVTTTESLNAAIQPAALNASIASIAQAGLVTGPAQVLTTGLDTLTGTSGNDVFNAVIGTAASAGIPSTTTLNPLDTITGGGGFDTLQINATAAITQNDLAGVTVSGVENVTVRSASTVTADLSSWSGVEQFNITEAVGSVNVGASATTNINASLKAGGTATTIVNGGKDVVVRVTDNAAAAQTISVGATTQAKGTVTVESTGKAAVASATAVDLGDITVKGGTTINVIQNATSSTAGLTVGTVTHNQGDISITGDASTTTVNVKQTAAAVAVAGVAAVAEVTEVASVKFGALTAGQSLTVGGLTFTATKDLTAAQVASAFSNLIQGTLPTVATVAPAPVVSTSGDTQGSGIAANGVYTGSFTGWTSAAANGDTVVFTAASGGVKTDLSFTPGATAPATVPTAPVVTTTTQGVDEDGETAAAGVTAGKVTVADSGTGSIKTISIDSYGTGSAITGSAVLETLNLSNSLSGITVADSAATLALNLNKIGTAATTLLPQTDAAITITTAPTTLNIKSTGANYIDLSAAGTETLNVSGTGTLKADVIDLSSLKTVVVTETAGLNTGATTLAATSVNTTGTTGSVTVAIDGTKATYTGGAGVDSVTVNGSAAIAKAISLGAGNDRLVLSNLNAATLAGTDAAVTLEGGEGTDTIVFSAAAAATLSATAGFDAKFNGFERLEVGTLQASATVNLDNMDDINYVISKGNVGAASVTLTATQGVNGVAGNNESAAVTFQALTIGQTYTIGGLTVTADSAATAAEVATAVLAGAGTTGPVTVTGAVTGYSAAAGGAGQVVFTSGTANTNVTPDLTVGGTGPAATVAVTQGVPAVAAAAETNVAVFNAMVAGQSLTIAGRTVTAAGAATAAEVAAAFISGANAGNLTVSGALAGWSVTDNGATATNDALFTSSTAANVADLTFTGTGAAGGTTLTLDKMLSGATVQQDASGAVEVKLADVTGTADIVNFIANGGNNATHTVTVAKVETINLTANDTVAGSGVSTNTVNLAADSATTVNVSGAGNLVVGLGTVTKAVTAVNGSTATGNLSIASSTATDAVAVTITGGSGNDVLTASGNKADVLIGGAGQDTLVAGSGLATLTGGAGNDLFKIGVASANVNSYATITDFAAGDLIQFVGATSFTSAKVSLGETAVFQDYANAAVNALAVGQMGWFQFGGNTYVVADMGANATTGGFTNTEDFIVKLTGTIDLSNASFNAQFGTIGLV